MKDEFKFSNVCVCWNKWHADLVSVFFEQLEKNEIKYVVLKNSEGLPYENFSKDIDILIQPGSYKRVAKILHSIYVKFGVTNLKINKFERLRCWYGFDLNNNRAIHIDLLEGFLHKGFELFPFELFYKHSYKNSNGVYVLDELYDAIILLLHSTICYHSIKQKYADKISKIYQQNKNEVDVVLKQVLGKDASLKMINLLMDGNYNSIAQKGGYFSLASKKKIFVSKPIFTLYNVFDFLFEKILRIVFNLNKYKIFCSVHAPDGTGKTTFIKFLGEKLGFYFVCNPQDLISIYHFRPNMLPNLGAVGEKVGAMKQDVDFTNPHRAKPVGRFSSFVRMCYYWVDYIVGMPIILRKNAQFDKITIFDRYIYDFLVDPRRSRINLPYWVRKVFAKLVKSPSLVFVLKTDADTIYNRKQELEKDEIERQLKEFDKLSDLNNNVYFLDASKTPDEIADEAIKIFIDKFTEKL